MTKYKCGHKTNGSIVLDDNELSILKFIEWDKSVGLSGSKKKCFECFIKEDKIK